MTDLDRIRERLDEAATKAVFEAEWDTVTWEEAKKSYRENDAWDRFKEDHAFYYQAGQDAVTLILGLAAETSQRVEWCTTHADKVMPHLSHGRCRWSLKVLADAAKKPCSIVSKWLTDPGEDR